ncbi:MAG: ATP-binding protein [Cyclobacteriaceae bacterium]
MSLILNFLKAPDHLPVDKRQYIFVCNVLSILFSVLAFGLDIALYLIFGWGPTLNLILLFGFLFFGIILLNKTGFNNAGRLLFCLVPVVVTMVITIYGKILQPLQSYIIYFDSRFILLVTAILPAIVFELKEKVKIAACILVSFLALVLFDPIHNALGVGYYQSGHTVRSYYYINYITFIAFVGLLSGIFVLKWRDQNASNRLRLMIKSKHQLNSELVNRNHELQSLTQEMEAHHEEMLQQQEELQTSHEMLASANKVIGEQQEKLQVYNHELESLVKQKSADLIHTNEELIKSNNELRQFSFTVSHNLRGPVARLLGLTNLVKYSTNEDEINKLTQFIHQSARELDSILKDLSRIIDIRNELYRVREKIVVAEEWEKTLTLVGERLDRTAVIVNFERAPYIFGIRPMVQSILYNLLSNAIKYRSPERMHKIDVRTFSDIPGQIIFEIEDNGLGIDLVSQRENLFKLYKRFHHHVAGKGMGLYLVKSQLEIMHGRIEVESEPDKGTKFRLFFPIPEDVNRQVFFENESAQLYYDAHINNTVIIWKRNVTSDEYHKVLEVVLQTIRTYNTPGWIADLREQGVISPDDQKWFISNVLKSAIDNGLKRIAAVGFADPIRADYYRRMIAVSGDMGVELRVFNSIESAVFWMKEFV